MRALRTALFTAAILAAGPAFALSTTEDMKNMPGMTHAAPAAKTGIGTGVITAIDAKAAKITIRHGPISAVGWPGMTMSFSASKPALLKGLKVGHKVSFDVKIEGSVSQVTAIRRQ